MKNINTMECRISIATQLNARIEHTEIDVDRMSNTVSDGPSRLRTLSHGTGTRPEEEEVARAKSAPSLLSNMERGIQPCCSATPKCAESSPHRNASRRCWRSLARVWLEHRYWGSSLRQCKARHVLGLNRRVGGGERFHREITPRKKEMIDVPPCTHTVHQATGIDFAEPCVTRGLFLITPMVSLKPRVYSGSVT